MLMTRGSLVIRAVAADGSDIGLEVFAAGERSALLERVLERGVEVRRRLAADRRNRRRRVVVVVAVVTGGGGVVGGWVGAGVGATVGGDVGAGVTCGANVGATVVDGGVVDVVVVV